MAKKKETNVPLILALVLFILTTIAFGVMWYLSYSDTETFVANEKKAKDDLSKVRNENREYELKARMYRLFIGMGEGDDKTVIDTDLKPGDAITNELKKANDALKMALGETDYDKLPAQFKYWEVGTDGKAGPAPDKGLLAAYGEIKGKEVAYKAAEKERDAYKGQIDSMKTAIAALNKLQNDFQAQIDKLPKDFKDELKKVTDQFDNRTKQYQAAEANANTTITGLRDEKDGLNAKIRKLENQIADLQTNNQILLDRLGAAKNDKFNFDEPQGKILRKLADNVVEINLGSAVNVRPGLTFTVLPSDFPEKGRQSRLKVLREPDGKGGFKSVERFVPRGAIEVYEVVGPNLALARIQQGTELDPIRDGVGVGDLIYNATWRKGVADRIALVGIFDVNGDGSDDIEAVVRDFTKMGIPVDAYYDMKKRAWVGQVTERTRFIVEGYFPINSAGDPNREEKTKLLGQMGEAITEGRKKGADTVNFRDFFARMGYKYRLDVTDDKINQATAPYLSNIGSNPIPMPPNP
jgi:prefoldin subunit 5